VAWFPSFPELERVEAFRSRHDPTARNIAAHLTLVFPFATRLSALQVETHVQRVASAWPPIPVTFRAVPEFAYEPHITLAREADAGKLESLQAEAEEHLRGEFSDVLRAIDLLSVHADGKIENLRRIALHTS
jgi:2'-5' RNA ligase